MSGLDETLGFPKWITEYFARGRDSEYYEQDRLFFSKYSLSLYQLNSMLEVPISILLTSDLANMICFGHQDVGWHEAKSVLVQSGFPSHVPSFAMRIGSPQNR